MEEHPESWRSFRARAQALEKNGHLAEAAQEWDRAVELAPKSYTLLVQAGEFHGRVGDGPRGDEYLRRAIETEPTLANAYQILAGNLLRRGLGREAHGVALEGLARAGTDQRLWALVSESYLLRGDLAAAVRAREAAIAADPRSSAQWARLSEILDAMGEDARAAEARARATELAITSGGGEP
jgi:tetratricopeptide (TPR) repeat protein